MSDVDEVAPGEIVGEGIRLPRAAAHGQRELERIIETAAIAERVRLIDEHTNDIRVGRELACMIHVLRVNAAGMAAPLIVENVLHEPLGIGKILGAVDREHERELLTGERMRLADARLLGHDELAALRTR